MRPDRLRGSLVPVLVLAIALIVVWVAGLPLGLRFAVAGLMLVAAGRAIYDRKRQNRSPR